MPLNETERDEYAEKYMRMAYYLARKSTISNDKISLEDKCDIALYGLAKAIDAFDPERGVAFSSFLWKIIHNEFLLELRKWRDTASLDAPVYKNADGDHLTLRDVIIDAHDCANEAATHVDYERALDKLPDKRKQAIKMIGDGATQREAADELNLSRAYACYIIKKFREHNESR